MPESSPSRVEKFMNRLFDETIVQSVLHEVGEKSTQVAKEMARHFAGLGLNDENMLRRSEEKAEEELIGVDGHLADEIRDRFNAYRQWILEESALPNLPGDIEPELKWRAKMWGLVVTTSTVQDEQKNIIKGLVMCQDEERERYLMSLIIQKPISLKVIDWLKQKWAELLNWLHTKFGPDIIAGIWRRIEEAVIRIWNRFLDFVEHDFIHWLTTKKVAAADHEQRYRDWLNNTRGFSLLGNWMTNGPFIRRRP